MEERSSQSPPPTGPVPSGGSTETRMNRDSIKKGFNDVMKFADVNFSRAKQVAILHIASNSSSLVLG